WGEAWEMQALLRAAFVAGSREVGEEFMEMIDEFRYPKEGVSEKTIREIRRMKARVDNERLPRGADRNTHTKLGRGALTDIEWTVQLLTMMHAHEYEDLHSASTLEVLDALEKHELLREDQVTDLRDAWLMATDARNALVLVRGKRVDQLPTPGPQLAQVAGAAGWAPEENQEFLDAYLKSTRHSRKVVDEVFWGEAESFEHD
ncbi:MAG: bifunctional glutamine-synthetase adenylyltransferase/deadenyltransferase, partial [Corynebacterium camporealensis]|nr:bifunctional glutamine-synthetase adenylyltransferase/deadenyltransferase [Corynebacterium camporealensis]